jgi:hypothetical protein
VVCWGADTLLHRSARFLLVNRGVLTVHGPAIAMARVAVNASADLRS